MESNINRLQSLCLRQYLSSYLILFCQMKWIFQDLVLLHQIFFLLTSKHKSQICITDTKQRKTSLNSNLFFFFLCKEKPCNIKMVQSAIIKSLLNLNAETLLLFHICLLSTNCFHSSLSLFKTYPELFNFFLDSPFSLQIMLVAKLHPHNLVLKK